MKKYLLLGALLLPACTQDPGTTTYQTCTALAGIFRTLGTYEEAMTDEQWISVKLAAAPYEDVCLAPTPPANASELLAEVMATTTRVLTELEAPSDGQ